MCDRLVLLFFGIPSVLLVGQIIIGILDGNI